MARHLLAADAVGDQRVVDKHNQLANAMSGPLAHLYSRHFDRWAGSTATPFEIPAEDASLIWLWREFDSDGLREFLRSAPAKNQWSLLDEIAWLIPVVISSAQVSRISRYDDLDYLAKLFDLGDAAVALNEEVENAGALENYRDIEATPENGRAFALALLKYRRDGERMLAPN